MNEEIHPRFTVTSWIFPFSKRQAYSLQEAGLHLAANQSRPLVVSTTSETMVVSEGRYRVETEDLDLRKIAVQFVEVVFDVAHRNPRTTQAQARPCMLEKRAEFSTSLSG